MQLVGDSAVEEAPGKAVEDLQPLGKLVGGELAHGGEVLVQDKAGLWVLLAAVEQAWTGVELEAAVGAKTGLNVQRALVDLFLVLICS